MVVYDIKNIWKYDKEIIKNKVVIIYGFNQESKDFAVRLLNQDIEFHYFCVKKIGMRLLMQNI